MVRAPTWCGPRNLLSRARRDACARRRPVVEDNMELGLSGRRALSTGGSQGIGRAVVETLLGEGASVALCARDREGVETAVRELRDLGPVVGHVCDFADDQAVRSWVDVAAAALGGVDILVSNASASG